MPMKGESLPPPPLDGKEYSVDLTSDATANWLDVALYFVLFDNEELNARVKVKVMNN